MQTKKLPGEEKSLWLATTEETDYPPLGKSQKYDVAIAGGGIAGLLTAWMLQKEGLKTVVVEKDRIVQNTTGNTTAKLTSQHNLIYDFLINEYGFDTAKAYAEANQQAIDDIDALARTIEVDCDFSRRDAYVYTKSKGKLKDIETELKAAQKLGLPASFETNTDLPFKVTGAIKFSEQAQFHPRKFLLAVAEDLISLGGRIFEKTEAKDIETGKPLTLKTSDDNLLADSIVVATKYPFWRAPLFQKDAWIKLSYSLGVTLKEDGQYPRGMYINPVGSPIRSIRSHPFRDGQILIFGGESHKMTKNYDKHEHYQKLIEDVSEWFEVDKILFRWIAGDMMPFDRLPYVGTYPGEANVFVITGFQAWGLAWAMAAAELISDRILGKKNRLAEVLSPDRLNK